MLLVGIVGTLCLMCLAFTVALGVGYFLGQPASSSTTISTPATRTRTPTTTVSKPAIGLNTPIEGSNSAVTVTSVDKIKTLALSNGDKRDATKGTWVIVYVTIQNKGKETLTLNADDYSLLDSAKTETKPSTGFYVKTFVTDKKLAFVGDKIEAGKTIKAAFGFDVDANAKGLQFYLRPVGAQVPLE